MSKAILTLRVTDELPPQVWQITERTAEIGRLPTSTIVLPHRSVSRDHAHISREGDTFLVEDLGSKNGTWLNDQQVKGPTMLTNGDTLLIGDVPLRVELVAIDEPKVTTPAQPAPLPPLPLPPPPPINRSAPSTVMVQLDDVLPQGQVRRHDAWEETPSTHLDISVPQPATPTPTPTPTPRPVMPPPPPQPVEHATVFAPLPVDLGPEPEPLPDLPDLPEPRPMGADTEPAAATLARLALEANKLADALRTFSGDLATSVWLFEHAGGRDAAQAFIDCVNAAYLRPDDAMAQRAVLDEAANAARLLQAAIQVMNGLLPLNVEGADGRGDEPQANTTELEPIARR